MKKQSIIAILSFAAASFLSPAFAAGKVKPAVKAKPTKSAAVAPAPAKLDIRPLADSREVLKPQAYTAAERELVARQALFFIKNMYVHREIKIMDFGAQVDPVPRLQDMVKKAASLSDSEFHAAMQKIFLDLHDHHTNYNAPLPLRCSFVLAPLFFTDVYDNGTLKVIVRGKSTALKPIATEVAPVAIGDELIAINGKPILSVIENLKRLSGGANPDAMTTGAIMSLSLIELTEQPAPAEDVIQYTLKSGSNTYKINSKYYVALNEESCVNGLNNNEGKKSGFNSPDFVNAENPKIKIFKDLILPPEVSPFGEDDPGQLPVGKFYTIDTPVGKIAKLDIKTFVPVGRAPSDDVIQHIKALLQMNQASSVGLVIDLRNNGGGLITLAEGLTQLFTPNRIQPMPVRLIPDQLNLSMFLNSNQGVENGWSKDTRDAIAANAKYTSPRAITSPEIANRYGQVWFKPVVILTDANCYSACDLFAAAMQDHAAATIIGTHASTGAGGANVMEYDIFRQIFDASDSQNNPFIKLPGKQSMRVSWRQTIRVGKNAGKLIEDAGVKSDIVVRYVTDDVVGGESKVLMKAVANSLSKIIPRYKSDIKLTSSLTMANGSIARWNETVKGVDTVEVRQGGTTVASYNISTDGGPLTIELANVVGNWSNSSFHVVGKLNGVTQFNVVRNVRWRGTLLNASSRLSESLADGLKFWHATQSSGPIGEGWQIKSGALRVGKGPTYSPSVRTEIFASLDTADAKNVVLNIGLTSDSEEGMDFVNIIVRDLDNGDEDYAASLSGEFKLSADREIKIPTNGMKHMEVVIEFISDENWNLSGPVITNLDIKAQ